jgi:uncharacterized protein (TIGR02246 family)
MIREPTIAAAIFASMACTQTVGLSEQDLRDIRRLEESYVTAWVANDSAAVMSTMASDAVILPGRVGPVEGSTAIRAFWFPAGPPTTVLSYRTDIDEVGGAGNFAFVRGRGHLTFAFADSTGRRQEQTNRSVFLMITRRDNTGSWKIARRMWSDLAG